MDFEDVKKVVTDAAKSVAQKSGEVLEYSKIKFKIYDIQNDINKLFAQIGQDVYESRNDGVASDTISEKCGLIDEKKAEIEELEVKLAELKNNKKCPDCGKITKKEDSFCPKCGITF